MVFIGPRASGLSASPRANATVLAGQMVQSSVPQRDPVWPTLRQSSRNESTYKITHCPPGIPLQAFPACFRPPSSADFIEFVAKLDVASMARFAVSDSQDQSAAVWIVTFLLLSYTTLTTLVRGFVKLKMMGLDDGVASVAQLFTYGHVICIIYALMHGFAKARPETEEDEAELEYGKVSERGPPLQRQTLTRSGATSKHRTVPPGTCNSKDSRCAIPAKGFSTGELHTCYGAVQPHHGGFGSLGRRSFHCNVCQLQCRASLAGTECIHLQWKRKYFLLCERSALTIGADKMACCRCPRRCHRDRYFDCRDLAGQSATDESGQEVHSHLRLCLEARVGNVPLRPQPLHTDT